MLKKLFKSFCFFYFSLSIIFFSFLVGIYPAQALNKEIGDQSSQNIVIESSINDKNSEGAQKEDKIFEERPDLGDDQVFPFVAGLDSYEK